MTIAAYPQDLTRRFAQRMQKLERDVRQLMSRTASIDSGMPLAVLPGVINPAYTGGDPRVLVNGSSTLTGPYQTLASYTPAASDAVLLIPVPLTANGIQGYIVLGRIT